MTPPRSRRVSRRRFVRDTTAAIAGSAVFQPVHIWCESAFDLLLHGGTVLDGTGAPAFAADVAIRGDAVAAIGSIGKEQARRVLDVSGLHVAPGFVDIHTHSDRDILDYPIAESRVLQGVTTELTGNCGSSAAPRNAATDTERAQRRTDSAAGEPRWTDVASYLAVLDERRLGVNHALLLGQGTLRVNAMGAFDRAPTSAEMAAILRAVEEGLDQGAFGLSSGLEYTPGRYTPADELVAMARVVARRGGLYASHIRNEEAELLEAIDEVIATARRADVRAQVSHLKASGPANWGLQGGAIDRIATARRDGVPVLADAYPYTAYSTGLTVMFPGWALEGGRGELLRRLGDPKQRARLRDEVAAYMARELRDYDRIVISSVRGDRNRAAVGRNMVEIARDWRLEPIDALLRLVEEEEGSVGYVGHGMSPENVEAVLRHPLVMIGSDGSAIAPRGRAAETKPHPRSYGAFARVVGYYVRERRLFDLETAVRKMTSMPADQIGLKDRGRLAPGRKADVVAFDAAAVKDLATYEDPHRYAAGIRHVLVNGQLVVEEGRLTGARPGRALRRA